MAEVQFPPRKAEPVQPVKEIPNDRHLTPIENAKPVKKKKNFFTIMAEQFFADDIPDLKVYLLEEVIVPGIKDFVADVVHDGIDMLLYNKKSPRRGRSSWARAATTTFTNYASFSNPRASRASRASRQSIVPKKPDDDKVFVNEPFATYIDDKGVEHSGVDAAYDVLNSLQEILHTGDNMIATVGDYYQLRSIPTNRGNFEWGWRNLDGVDVVRIRDGRDWLYLIDFPDPEPI